jgi:transcription-repair coupling factor (superfamily II helicase)
MDSATQGVLSAQDQLLGLAERLSAEPGFAAALASLTAGNGANLDGVWGSSCALVAAGLVEAAPGPLIVVCAHGDAIDDIAADLELFTRVRPDTFPAWESSPRERVVYDEIYGERMRLLKALASETPPRLIVTSIQSLLQPVPRRESLAAATRRVRRGDTLPVSELAEWLVARGFHSTSAVELPGEVSIRGGIIDVFAPDWLDPVRIEFFGDEIESLRRFEVTHQRSLATLDEIDLTVLSPTSDDREHFTGYLAKPAWLMLVEPGDLEEEGRHYLERLERPQEFHSVSATLRQLYQYPSLVASGIANSTHDAAGHLRIESVERFSGDLDKVRHEFDTSLAMPTIDGREQEIFIACQTEAEAERLREVFAGTRLGVAGRLHYPIGRLKSGFRLVSQGITLVSGSELFQRADLNRPSRRRLGRAIDSFLDLREGDYVVHLSHGIARYRGLKLLAKEQQAEEHLILEFRDETKIYVPVSKIELVQKYVGGSKSRPTLAKIGGRMWSRQKEAAERAVNDLAVDMLQLQAARALRPGISFGPDTAWQQEFDASFPYQETPDQLLAIASIKRDMQQQRPMDRLLCGDVGFGKTELAMRAAFKAVDAGYQVAVLAPTTILVEQHRRSFAARMAEFPFTIKSLSRFSTPKQQRETLEGIADGSVDIVIATHRLAQADVTFENLGLLIIDEEQRFGVEVKERLKALRQIIDVLTMTATPIPRTLHLSLLGVRDISNLETAPQDRLAVETRVTRFSDELVRHAVLRELNRDGQIYFVHNRVQDIHQVAQRLGGIVPEARIIIGHGQMPEGELEEVMLAFVDHRADILVATTIVESGLDIPNANTIFIDEADRYGLADLHQLRGRVGRYKHRAYAYLLVDPNRHLSPQAAKRLRAIEEFSDIGAGFSIAMRDLELRGAGNILGTQQSGHIATVGYELYCELLDKAIRELKKMPLKKSLEVSLDLPIQAFIPRTYAPDMRTKIDIYRRLARVAEQHELDDLAGEFVDRFGPRPPEVDSLLLLAQMRIWAHHWQITDIHLEDGFIVLAYQNRKQAESLVSRSKRRLRIVDEQSAYLPIAKGEVDPAAVVAEIKALLRPA